jgi:outer membrane lipoprotein-sorting protein
MKLWIFWIGILAIATTLPAETPSELLARIDAQRSVPDMSFEMRITSYQGDQVKDTNDLVGFIQSASDENKTLLWFSGPASVQGRKMLMDGNTVYLLFPKTSNPIRLSPLQVLSGESSNGDVARTGFAQEYTPASVSDAVREGKPCWQFDLAVKESRRTSSYRQAKLWVEKATLQPLYAEFFTQGDQPFKTIQYKNYAPVAGKMVPFLMVITNGDDPQRHTEMLYRKISSRAMPATAFRREYLQSWSPQ